ncbi:MAG: hypothetical protein PHC61_14035 [Chitinivibrionales bacterium]|nr:hypothetical protein [Chitinivibrionales bacterium]
MKLPLFFLNNIYKSCPLFLLLLVVSGPPKVYSQSSNAQQDSNFVIKHLTGPLISVDVPQKNMVIREQSVDYLVKIDSATLYEDKAGTIALADLHVGDSISIEYRKYADKKRISNKVRRTFTAPATSAPDTAAKQPAKIDSVGSLATKLPQSQRENQNFSIKHLNGPLALVDAIRWYIAIQENGINYPIGIDASTVFRGKNGAISLADFKIGDSVFVEYKKYADKKRVADTVLQKTAVPSGALPALKADSVQKTKTEAPKPQPSVAKKDTTKQIIAPPQIQASKKMMEEKLSGKSREQLYREYFNTTPPKQPKEVQATLSVNEVTDGLLDIVFSEDHQDFSMPATPVIKTMAEITKPQLMDKIKAHVDGSGSITQKYLTSLGLQVDYKNQESRVIITVPPILRNRQIHEVNGSFRENPYSVESIKPDLISAYINMQADQRFKYAQSLSHDTSFLFKERNRDIRQPFYGYFDGALNIKNAVLEGSASYLEGNKPALRRQDVRLVYNLAQRGLKFSAGDIQYPTLDYMSSMRLGGLCLAKDFSLQPYILTYPVGEYQFYLTDQAEAEVWINDVMVKKMVLDAGTHDIRGFPFAMGNNKVKIVLTDLAGRSQTIEFNFLFQQALMAKGLAQYSFNFGVPSSNNSDGGYTYATDRPVVSLTYRRGLTNTVTAYGYSQAFSQGINSSALSLSGTNPAGLRTGLLGGGGLFAFPRGTIQFGGAASYGRGVGPDFAARFAYSYLSNPVNNRPKDNKGMLRLNNSWPLNFQAEYIGPDFSQTYQSPQTHNQEKFNFSSSTSMSLAGQLSMSLSGNYYVNRYSENLFQMMLRLQKTWLRSLQAALTIQYSSDAYGGQANPGVMFNLSYTFRGGNNDFVISENVNKEPPPSPVPSSMGAISTPGSQWDFGTGLSWVYDDPTPRPEKLSASANAVFGRDINDYNASVGLMGNHGSLMLTQDMNEPQYPGANYLQHQTDINLKTALVFANGLVGFSRPIYGGFVIVKGIKSLSNSRVMINPSDLGYDAVSDAFGPAVLPIYSSFLLKRIRIEPENPSLGALTEKNKFTLFPQYKSGFSIAVGSEKTILVTGKLLDVDDSVFDYQAITIMLKGNKKAQPIKTFTNGAGRFQFLGILGGTYYIITPSIPGDKRYATVKIPSKNKGFFNAGTLKFVMGKEEVLKAKVPEKTFVPPSADSSGIPWIYVQGSFASRRGIAFRSTPITIAYLDSVPTLPPNVIYYPNSVTNKNGDFQFVCRRAGQYKITIASGANRGVSAIFEIPAETKGKYTTGVIVE